VAKNSDLLKELSKLQKDMVRKKKCLRIKQREGVLKNVLFYNAKKNAQFIERFVMQPCLPISFGEGVRG